MIYSIMGYGKGKTESAIGITVRAVMNDDNVLFVQFLKDGNSKEIEFFSEYNGIEVLTSDISKITLPHNLTTVDKYKAQTLFGEMLESIEWTQKGLVVADEILPALDMGLLTIEQVEYLVRKCQSEEVDLYMTGRIRQKSLRHKIAEISDVCTDAHCIKHSFNTHCGSCGKDWKYHYTYCPDCSTELVKSRSSKVGRDS